MLFDNILTTLEGIFLHHDEALRLRSLKHLFFVNRDLRGRIVMRGAITHQPAA